MFNKSIGIICDIDGVICDVSGHITNAWNTLHPTKPLSAPTAFRTADAYPWMSPESLRWWESAYNNPYYYATAPVMGGALAMVLALRTLGCAIYFRSSRPEHLLTTTRTWLEAHGFLTPYCPKESLSCGPETKMSALALHGPERLVFIDDHLETLTNIALNYTFDRPLDLLLLDASYNRNKITLPQIKRMRGHVAIGAFVRDLWLKKEGAA